MTSAVNINDVTHGQFAPDLLWSLFTTSVDREHSTHGLVRQFSDGRGSQPITVTRGRASTEHHDQSQALFVDLTPETAEPYDPGTTSWPTSSLGDCPGTMVMEH